MGAAHGTDWLYRPGTSPLHRASAQAKVIATLAFAVVVVVTPRDWFSAFAVYALVLASLVVVAGIAVGHVARRLLIEVPFVAFALLMPFVADGPRTELLGLTVSETGLCAAWALLAKATLSVVAATILASTTPARRMIVAVGRLGLPAPLTQIMAFMLRYTHVVADESARMRLARASRGFEPRSLRSWRVLSHAVGALFVRSYGRGERVHLAMLARGYQDR